MVRGSGVRLCRVGGDGWEAGARCDVGHVAHAGGCSFPFFLSSFLVFLVVYCSVLGFWVFRYVGECVICPSQCVFVF